MKHLILVPIFTLLAATTAQAQFEWTYQRRDEVRFPQDEFDENEVVTVPGSSQEFTRAEIDGTPPPDWFPEDHHAPPPRLVTHGAGPEPRACGRCHGYAGSGHPESSHLSGMSANYIIRQMAEFKSGARKDPVWMNRLAAGVPDEDIRELAEWYAGVTPRDFIDEVIETDNAPKTYLGPGRMRYRHPDGGTEPIGNRVLEVPQDRDLVHTRHPYSGFTVYAPVGSVARGEALANGGGGKTVACAICHGEGLKGLGDVPRLAGISPLYAMRNIWSFKTGTRAGSLSALMGAAVANLTEEDVVDLAAYMATLDP